MLRCLENFVFVEDTVGSCLCSFFVLRNSGFIFKVFLSEKELILIKFFGLILEYWYWKILVFGLICLIWFVMVSSSFSDIKSVLLRSIWLVKVICLVVLFFIFLGFLLLSCVRMCFVFVIVMILLSINFFWMLLLTKNVCVIGVGFVKFVVSMMTASNCVIFE